MTLSRKFFLTLTFLVCGALFADDVAIAVHGMGPSYRSAVNEALLAALEQYCGITISNVEKATLSQNDSSVTTNGEEASRAELNDAIKVETEKLTKGRISRFEVTAENYDPASKQYSVDVTAYVPGPYVIGLDPGNRRRMAVGQFYMKNATFSCYGVSVDTLAWTEAFADNLNIQLTQSRKFTMLDRKFKDALDSELKLISGENASPADVVRLNQKLGTDYLLVGSINFYDLAAPPVNPYTGQPMPVASAVFAEVTYRVLLAATGQLKWTDKIKLDAASYLPAAVNDFVSISAEHAAVQIADSILSAILPMEVVGVTKNDQVVIGVGGKSLQVGEILEVYELGDEVCDTRTGEVLDVVEVRIAQVMVQRVTEKLSYACVLEGDIAKIPVGARLRRKAPGAEGQPQEVQMVPVPTNVRGTTNGGVLLPF